MKRFGLKVLALLGGLFVGSGAVMAQTITFNGLPNNSPDPRYCHVEVGSGSCSATIAWDQQNTEDPQFPPTVYVISVVVQDQYDGSVNAPYPGAVWWCGYRVNGAGVGSTVFPLTRHIGYIKHYTFTLASVSKVWIPGAGTVPATCNNVNDSLDWRSLKGQDVYAW